MQPVAPNPSLLGMPQDQVIILSEKQNLIAFEGFNFCVKRCITHFGEDSIPYHYGEKSCLDRCISKVADGMYMAINIKNEFDGKLKAGEMPYQWIKDAAEGKIKH